ncbi:MAG: TIGR04283 family arsenosugar biosynthesis glycosyltransferase [Gammaproteobacteria bacterium]|nr:TIGR04283 family arsenosugar biosynthesis glycosyltransferase [Gammaproteobacteria bacterium]MDH5652738.1 TIGR04283 family arsenosugar biosynthesis glycosyltransferase [Gammaproteobacteria bacterium]
MKLSFIIPVLNEAERIQSFLFALLPYQKRGHEVIIVDGGSRDETVKQAQHQADRVITSARGRARQMNAGAAEASGDVLVFLHADTVLPAHADLLITQSLTQAAAVWGRFDVKLSGTKTIFRLIAAIMNVRSRLTGIATGDQCIFVKRDVFDQINGFPLQALMEDIEISKRLKRISRPYCLRPQVITSSRRWEEKGICRTILLMWYLRARYFCGSSPDKLEQIYYQHG